MSNPPDRSPTGFEPRKDPRTPRSLKARFPYMFPPDAELTLFRGWMPAMAQACIEIDATLGADNRGFHFTRIREKFGTARVRYYLDDAIPRAVMRVSSPGVTTSPAVITRRDRNAVAAAVGDAVLRFEATTARVCLICGAATVPNADPYWLMTLCAAHQPPAFNFAPSYIAACLEADDE